MNLIVTGSLAFDHIMVFPDQFKKHILPDKIHILNVSFNVDSLQKEFGGTAGNVAYNLRLLEDFPLIVGTVGKDFSTYAENLQKLKISTEHIHVLENEFTAQCFITTDQDDNQITAFHGGAMFQADQKKLTKNYVHADDLVIISPNGKEAMIEHAEFCRKNGVKFIFDPGQSIPAFSDQELLDCIQGSEFLVVNDYEWQLIQDKTDITEENVFQYTQNLIVTLGAKGSLIRNQKEEIKIKIAQPREVVDPTGCGDAYRAGLMFALKQDFDLKKCGQIASVVASFAIEKKGTQNHQFGLNDFKERYRVNFE